MPIPNPAEQLIQDLVKDRAKEFQETVRRFKARQAQNKKAADGYAKRRVEYLRKLGIKVDELVQHEKEEARLLKTQLDATRPPLIARPSLSVQDAGHGAQLTARLGALGQIVVPTAGFYYPP